GNRNKYKGITPGEEASSEVKGYLTQTNVQQAK
ncbi:unnamed protein product, partial [Litomosoides sigmodontis]